MRTVKIAGKDYPVEVRNGVQSLMTQKQLEKLPIYILLLDLAQAIDHTSVYVMTGHHVAIRREVRHLVRIVRELRRRGILV